MHEGAEVGRVGKVAVVEEEPDTLEVRVLVQVLDAPRVEAGGAADDAVHHVPLLQEELGQVRAVLPGDPRDQRHLAIAISRSAASCRLALHFLLLGS